MTIDIQRMLQHGLAHQQQGRLPEACQAYEAVLDAAPQHLGAWTMLGMAAAQMRDYTAAANAFEKAIAIKPDLLEAHVNLGNVLMALGRAADALSSYERAIALRPDLAQIRYNIGNALWRLGRPTDALSCYEQVLQQKPDFASAHNSRGALLLELRRFPEALASVATAIRLNPDNANAHNNIGNVLMALNRADEAVRHYDIAASRDPSNAEIHHNRGTAMLRLRRMEEAVASFERAFALQPDGNFLLGNVVYARLKACRWDGLDGWLERLEEGLRAGRCVINPFSLLSMMDRPDLHRRAAEIYADAICPAAPVAAQPAARAAGGKIRIGYFSADFHSHATAELMAGLFEMHDRSKFEVYGFSFGPGLRDEMRARLVSAFDVFIDVENATDAEIAEKARAFSIDVAIDLKGYTQDARPGIFAARCAPVQVSYLGYPGTLGRNLADYIIADQTVLPRERWEDYSEVVVHLPHSYQANDSRRRIADTSFSRAELGLPDNGFVYCCFNNNHKILPATFDSWMRILASVDGSVLWLLEDNPAAASNLRREAERRGVSRHRLVFATRMKSAEHLARHRCADLFLDTLPYNAHTTASDALWAGLPVLTCMGQSFASRVGASLLKACGLGELIARDMAAYEAMAVELAQSPGKLDIFRRHLAQKGHHSPLFNTSAFARHIEAAYLQMHDRRQHGLAPEAIVIG